MQLKSTFYMQKFYLGWNKINVGRLELRFADEFGFYLFSDPIQGRRLGVEPQKASHQQSVDPFKLDQPQNKRRLLQKSLGAEIADGEGMDFALLRELHPIALAATLHARHTGSGEGGAAPFALRPEQLAVGKPRKPWGVLAVAVDVVDRVRVFDNDGRHFF